jgi:calcium-dependent protein kinase
VIGQGSFGIVRKCQHRKTKQLYACKTIAKSNDVPSLELVKREVDNLKRVGHHHPHIIQFHEVYEDAKSIHLITELCTGRELYDLVLEKKSSPEKHFAEEDAAWIIRNILDAIAYCHEVHQIAHRDLKASNFLFLHPEETTRHHIKIIDFGLSCRTLPRQQQQQQQSPPLLGVMNSRVGTPYYVAPEVLTQDEYTNKCDVWSIGVIAYLVLSGTLPFHGSDERETIQLLLSKESQVEFPDNDWEDISKDAQAFCRLLLQKDPDQRPTALDARSHPWFVHCCGEAPPLLDDAEDLRLLPQITTKTTDGDDDEAEVDEEDFVSAPRRNKSCRTTTSDRDFSRRLRWFPRLFRKSKSSALP